MRDVICFGIPVRSSDLHVAVPADRPHPSCRASFGFNDEQHPPSHSGSWLLIFPFTGNFRCLYTCLQVLFYRTK